jgi:hypothetical protein
MTSLFSPNYIGYEEAICDELGELRVMRRPFLGLRYSACSVLLEGSTYT